MNFWLLMSCQNSSLHSEVEENFVLTEEFLDNEIVELGELSSDKQRYEGLVLLRDLVGRDVRFEELAADLDTLLPVADQWANGRDKYWEPGEQDSSGEGGYLGGFFVMRVFPGQEDNSYPPVLSSGSKLEPIWALYRGRMLIWTAIENGLLTESFFQEGRMLLEQSYAAFPNSELIKMYLGERIPWELDELSVDAPEWVHLQNRSILALSEIMKFWVVERQATDGQFGGGWGDDVEMWRWWTPILLGFEDPQFIQSQRLLAEGIFDLERLSGGYTNKLIDVEHGSEDTADSLTPMLLLFPEEQLWADRALVINNLMTEVWMSYNDQGHLHFRSSYLSSEQADADPDKACDTPYHTRVVQPVLHLLQRGELAAEQPVLDWLNGWNQAASQQDNGKPFGIPPAAVAFPSGSPFGDEWWNPGCHYVDTTFKYPRAFSMLGRAMVLAEHHTQDPLYQSTTAALVELRNAQLSGELISEGEGSAGWAVDEIKGHLNEILQKEWLLNGVSTDDQLLYADGSDYVRYRLNGDEDLLKDVLSDTAQALSWNKQAYTSEVRFTDRVLKFHSRYWNDVGEERMPGVNTTLIYNMVTGDLGDATVLALPAVKWGFSHKTLRVNVVRATEDELYAELFSISEEEESGEVNLFRLGDEGVMRRLSCPSLSDEAQFSEANFEISLPPQELCTLIVERL